VHSAQRRRCRTSLSAAVESMRADGRFGLCFDRGRQRRDGNRTESGRSPTNKQETGRRKKRQHKKVRKRASHRQQCDQPSNRPADRPPALLLPLNDAFRGGELRNAKNMAANSATASGMTVKKKTNGSMPSVVGAHGGGGGGHGTGRHVAAMSDISKRPPASNHANSRHCTPRQSGPRTVPLNPKLKANELAATNG
jgi:hypothetical protein